MMLGKIGAAFKWLGKNIGKGAKETGKGALWIFTRPETRLIASFVPIPGIKTAVEIVGALNAKDLLGTTKAAIAVEKLRQDPLFKDMKESELRWIIETALQIVEGRIKYEERKDDCE